MKKILIVNEWLVGGGVEKVMQELVYAIVGLPYQITIATLFDSKDIFKANYPSTIKYYHLRQAYKVDKYPVGSVRHIICALKRRFFQIIARLWFSLQNYDVIIAMEEGSCMKLLSKVRAKKRLAWVHTDFESNHWTKGVYPSDEAERVCMTQYEHVVCVSQTVALHIKELLGDPENLCVRYNPINYEEINVRAQERCSITKLEDRPLFVSVGRLAYPKNYAMLLDVCKELSQKYSFELWIIGDGPDREELQKRIDIDQIGCVKLLGNQANVFSYLKQADVFVSSSLSESYGLAVQEALIVGVPVVAIDCPGIAESFDERFGLLAEPTKQSLKAALEYLLAKPETVMEYRENIRKHYVIDNLYSERIKEIMELFERTSH